MDNTTHNSDSTVVFLSTASCSVSILGAFAIFATFYWIPEIRNSTRKLVVCLNIADFLTPAGYLMSSIAYYHSKELRSDNLCVVQSIITTFSSLVSFFFTVFIAVHIFVSVVTGRHMTSSLKFFILTNVISWFVPATIVCIAAAEHVLGKSDSLDSFGIGTGPWCWVKNDNSINALLWRFLTGKAWEFLCYLCTTCLYILLKFYLFLGQRYRSLHDMNQHLREEDRNFLYVWFILYLLRVWGSVRFIFSHFKLDQKDKTIQKVSNIFVYLQALGDPAQAFGNFILLCVLDKTVRKKFIEYFCSFRLFHIEDRELGQQEHSPLIKPASASEGTSPRTSVSASQAYDSFSLSCSYDIPGDSRYSSQSTRSLTDSKSESDSEQLSVQLSGKGYRTVS